MSRLGDSGKAKEAQDAMNEGDKHLQTGLLKWKADYLAAEPCFQKAGRAFKAAGLVDSAIKAWRKAADCALKMGNPKQAVVTLETASRELSYSATSSTGTSNNYKEIASQYLSEAAGILYELGETPRAAELKLRAGKFLEGFSNDKAAAHYDEAASYFDGDEEKDVYAKEALSKVLSHQLGLGKHASAMKTMDKLAAVYIRLNQPHNLSKLILGRVVLLLAAADPVTAQKEYERQIDAPGFASSQEAGAAEDLLAAVQSMNPDAVKAVVDKNVFNYLDNAITRIAKGLPNAVLNGTVVGAAHAGEVATKGVTHAPAPAAAAGASGLPAGWKVIGGGGNGYGGGAGAAALGATDSSSSIAGSAVATRAAAKQAEADAGARSALFARPAAGGASSSSSSSYDDDGDRYQSTKPSASSSSSSAPAPAPANAGAGAAAAGNPFDEHSHGGDGDGDSGFDFDKAVADLEIHGESDDPFGSGSHGHHEDASSAPAPAKAPAPAPAPAADAGGDDLGLL